MEPVRVLDLFAGTQSVRKALVKLYQCDRWEVKDGVHRGYDHHFKEPIIEYIGIDIYSPEGENMILSLNQENIIEKLKEMIGDWYPNVIWASPLCTPFSRAVSINGGTLAYEYDKETDTIKVREDFASIEHGTYKKRRNDPDFIKKHTERGITGLRLMKSTMEIVDHYKYALYAIENPAYALSQYILSKGRKRHVTHYCQYGFNYKKPTAIYSNIDLNLKKCNHKIHEYVMSGSAARNKTGQKNAPSSNKDRSRVPEDLIISIYKQFFGLI